MGIKNSFLLTTTSSLEGYTIKQYLGIVSANIVTGTGLFSDIGAGFRDIFGGRSQSYQKQLQQINDEVQSLMIEKAKKMGANSVIGSRIDYDEISGKGMQMFMVTASGTAIISERISEQSEMNSHRLPGIESTEVDERLKIMWATASLIKNKIGIKDEVWEIFIKRKEISVIEPIFNVITLLIKNPQDPQMFHESQNYGERRLHFLEKSKQFILSLPIPILKVNLYHFIKKDFAIYNFMEEIIKEAAIIDLDEINELLDIDNFIIKKKILQLLLLNLDEYYKEDILKFEKIIEKINTSFEDLSTTKEGGVFSKKEKWVCSFCKTSNDANDIHCQNYSCGLDRYGFTSKEYNPEEMINFLSQRISVLKEIFSELK